jgi:NhaP-type Na+/H+ or K+/H+ antiporter
MFCFLQLGADEKLSSLIDAESLVNDGSAFSIFLVLQGIVGGKWLSANEVSAQQWAKSAVHVPGHLGCAIAIIATRLHSPACDCRAQTGCMPGRCNQVAEVHQVVHKMTAPECR